MKTLLKLFAVLLTLALGGCASVFVTEPIGEEVVVLDPAKWQGTWLNGELALMTTVLDAEAGLLEAAWLERGEGGAKFESYRGHVRRSGDWLFISMPREAPEEASNEAGDEAQSAGEPEVAEFLWARLEADGRTALVWWPDPENFRVAVREGRVPGIVKEDDDVRLGKLEQAHLALINDPASGLLGWEEPMVFIRIGD